MIPNELEGLNLSILGKEGGSAGTFFAAPRGVGERRVTFIELCATSQEHRLEGVKCFEGGEVGARVGLEKIVDEDSCGETSTVRTSTKRLRWVTFGLWGWHGRDGRWRRDNRRRLLP